MFSFGRDLYRVVGRRAIKLAAGIPPEAVAAGESTIAAARLAEPATNAYNHEPSWSSAGGIAFVGNAAVRSGRTRNVDRLDKPFSPAGPRPLYLADRAARPGTRRREEGFVLPRRGREPRLARA